MRVSSTLKAGKVIGSASRTLHVFEAILEHGPIKPAEICKKTKLDRTSVHRAIHILIKQGWVRNQLGSRSCVATYKFDQLAADATFSQPVQDKITPILKELCTAHYLHGDIAFLIGTEGIKIVESTDSKLNMGTRHSLALSDISIAIYSIMKPEQIARFTSRALQNLEPHEVTEITSGILAQRIVKTRENNHLAWSSDSAFISVPFLDKTQLLGAVRLRQKTVTSTGHQVLTYVANELKTRLPNLFQIQ